MNLKEYLRGESFDSYHFFGVHPHPDGGWIFRTYAPHAKAVTLEGDFSQWREIPPVAVRQGVYEFHYRDAAEGQLYKYCIYSKRGVREEHADPYGFGMEHPPRNASVIRDLSRITWSDERWMTKRTRNPEQPVSIYEMHAISWIRGIGNWRNLAAKLIPYLKKFHFTHVELLPVGEHPMEGSWGYQCTGFFSPTARLGTAYDFASFVDSLHCAGIGVILDFVGVHFASDRYGLKMYDGAALYESKWPGSRRSDWGSFYFDHGKPAVRSFLQSAADYWLNIYHIDGLRLDAVSHLIYRNGKAENGENTEGILFLQGINAGLRRRFPSALLIAEDSSLYYGTTAPLDTWGGLGFDYKWDMGWTYDLFSYMQTAPAKRGGQSHLLTLGIRHRSDAKWLLPFSHDDAAWKNFYERMPGAEGSKLRQAKLALLYMGVHPGKKLIFMGTEQGVSGSWSLKNGMNWQLDEKTAFLEYGFFVEDLFSILRDNPALYEADQKDWGAQWVSCDDGGNGIYAMMRHSETRHVLTLMNFSAVGKEHEIHLPGAVSGKILLHTDWRDYGGRTAKRNRGYVIKDDQIHFRLPRFSGMMMEVFYRS